jgi:TonB-linked SusC/RagA family outer membrane protein
MKYYAFKPGMRCYFSMPPKLLWIMNMIVVILTTCLLQVSAATWAQRITLSERNAPLDQVLQKIRLQSGFNVVYASDFLAKSKKVNLQFSDLPLETALDQIFKNQSLTYSIQEQTIIIKERPISYLDKIIARFQAIDVRGKILDEKGEPLVGATVSVKGSGKSVKTNAKGEFSLQNVEEKEKLMISYIGYQNRELDAASDMGSITMKLADAKLEEVMINAGYYTVKDSERTGSISRITSKDIETQPVTNVLATMQGRMAGVEIIQDGGTAGGGFQIKVRGINSLRENGNELLYIIDGVPYSSEPIGYFNTSTGTPTPTSPLNSINPANIESIEVLKDADATAIYGSRGANGVVLITTKKGKSGKTTFNISSSTAFGKVTKMLNMMNTEQYLEMRKQGFANDGVVNYPANAYDVNGTWDKNRYTDWQDVLMGGTAKINNFQVAISGGSELTQYLISGNYRTETTVLPADFKYGKGAAHLSLNHSSQDKKFKLTFSGGYNVQDNLQANSDVTRSARNLAPNAPALYNADGSLNFQNSTFQNPLATLRQTNTVKVDDLVANTVLGYQIIPGLEVKANLGYTNLHNTDQRLLPSTALNPALNRGSERSSIYSYSTSRQSWIVEPQISFLRDLKFGTIETLLGTTFQQQKSSNLYLLGTGFASNSLITNIAAATSKNILSTSNTTYKYQAFFGRFNYKVADKYILNLTARRDGSSRFGPGKQFAVFGAIGATWLFSKENFLKENSVLSFGKLRISYGSAGNDQIGDYEFLNTYTSSGLNYQGIVGLDPSRLYNPDFGWESNRKFETALETGFLKDRIFLTAAWYRNRSSNQLVGIPLPGTTGFNSINANLNATVQNSGVEFTLRTINLTNEHFNWTSNFNISKSNNKLISFPGLAGSTYSNRYIIGKSINIRKVYRYTGLNRETGLYEVADTDNNGVINSPDDKRTTVDFNPQFFGGLQNEFSYKKWRLDFLFQFVKQRVEDWTPYVQGGAAVNQRAELANAWQQKGDNVRFQKNSSGENGNVIDSYYNFVDSDAAYVNGSYIRLKNISLSYDLPLPLLKIAHCRISLQGQNVLTFSPYKGGDPEFRYTGYLPPLRVYNASVQLTF